MLQIKLNGIKDIGCTEVPELGFPESEWAVVQTEAVGICGSDMHVYLGENPVLSPPRIQGHEFSGIVKSLNGSSDIKPGDRVTVNPVVGCGNCNDCKSEKRYLCNKCYVIGGEVPGAFGGEVYVPIRNLVPIVDSLSFVDATLIEPTSVAIHTVGSLAGKNVLIIGQGAIGLLCLQIAIQNGNRVISMDVSDEMLSLAQKLGCKKTINSKTQDAVREIKNFLEEEPLDAVIDVVCNLQTVEFSIKNVRKGGLITWVGIPKASFQFDLVTFLCNELKLHTSYLYTEQDFLKAKSLVEQKMIDAKTIISKVFKFRDAAEGFSYKLNVPSVKVVIEK